MSGQRKLLIILSLVSVLAMVVLAGCGQSEDGDGDGEGGQSRTVGVDWERVPDETASLFTYAGEEVLITDVCAGGPGLVAVGYRQLPDRDSTETPSTLLIWTSEDGLSWDLLGADAFTAGAGPLIEKEYSSEQKLRAHIASGPAGLVIAWGLHIFKSEDGLSWSEVSGVASFESSQCDMNSATGRFTYTFKAEAFVDLIGTPQGYVASAFGSHTRPGMQGWLTGPSIWTSLDAENWSLAQAEYVEQFGMASVPSITAGGPGLVAVGRGVEEDYDTNGSGAWVWTGSADGSSWSRVPDDPAIFGGLGTQAMESVCEGGPGLVAVGYESFDISGGEEYTGIAWTSPDGTTWERSSAGETAFADAELTTVAAGGPGLAAAGVVHEREMLEDRLVSETMAAAAWTSADGLSWNRVMLPASGDEAESNVTPVHIASWPGGLVVVGYMDSPGSEICGVIWVSLSQ